MERTNLYETIFKRKSIRKYDLTPLDEDTLAEISKYMSTLNPMYDNIKTEIKIVSQKDVKGMGSAPHYIVAFSETKDGYLENVGFMLQQIDLFLSANGIGACWRGLQKPTKETLSNSKLEFVILLAFGKPKEPLHRESVSKFKRKPLRQISNITGADELLEPARLAPSATNNQPWFFTRSDDLIHAYCAKAIPNMFKKWNAVSIGIALCHLWIAAKHFSKNTEFISDKTAQNNAPSGRYYITSLKVK
jgi:nitroreductase